jgi:hypothetical protein
MYNHLEDNFNLADKQALFKKMCAYYRNLGYDPFEVAIPLTFHIKSTNDSDYIEFSKKFKRLEG